MSLIQIEFNVYVRIFFSFKKTHSNWFTNHWILIFIPQILLLFYVCFARSNLVEGLDPVPDLLTFLQVIHINIGVMATSIHTFWQELTSTL